MTCLISQVFLQNNTSHFKCNYKGANMHRYLEIVLVLEQVHINLGSFWSYKVFGSPLPPSPIGFLSCLELTSFPTKVPQALGIIRVRINMIMNRPTMISLHHAKIRDFWEEVNTRLRCHTPLVQCHTILSICCPISGEIECLCL